MCLITDSGGWQQCYRLEEVARVGRPWFKVYDLSSNIMASILFIEITLGGTEVIM